MVRIGIRTCETVHDNGNVFTGFQYGVLLFHHLRTGFVSVEDEERFHGRVPNALVPVKEPMVHDEEEAQRGRLGDNVWLQILAAQCGAGLGVVY